SIKVKLTMMKKRPDMFSQVVSIPSMGRTVSVVKVNGDDVSVKARGQEQPVSGKQKQNLKKNTVMFPILKYNNSGNTSKLLGVRMKNGRKLYVVQTTKPNGVKIKDYFDTDTGLRTLHKVKKNDHTQKISYSDYRSVDGIKLPFKQSTDMFGRGMEMTIQKAKINSGLDDS